VNALVFGISGQDGFYLGNLLGRQGIRVVGVSRSDGCGRWIVGDVAKSEQVEALVRKYQPDYIFHLAADSTTRHDTLFENHAAIATGTLAILDAVDRFAPKAKVLLAGSGLQFLNKGFPLNEESPLDHSSPYVIARNSSLFTARYFRQRGLKVYFAYLFNHDSPLRSNRHLNMKIAVAAAAAANGCKEKLLIGDLNAEKEFSFAGDVTAAMCLLIQQDELFECVVGSGQSYAVRDWIEACFRKVGLDWNDYTETDPTYASPYRRLVSDPAKLLSLGWKPEHTFSDLAEMMMAEAARRCEVSERKADRPERST
jgi:GDPmannose 4,6-dehydratase